MMLSPVQVEDQINQLVAYLVQTSLSDSQHYAFRRPLRDNFEEVTFRNAGYISGALKDRAYDSIYRELAERGAYTAKMLDGALIQMMYIFSGVTLERHRLAFFPAPHLEEFQNDPDIYLEDEIYADIISRGKVPFPIRFDYDARSDVHVKLEHPKSHLTLGQYKNCRIPVTAPMTPFWFIDFVLRNFYHTAFAKYADELPSCGGSFVESILPEERGVVHISVPA